MSETPPAYFSGVNKQLQRIYEITGCKTQIDLAALLGIRQSSVSFARKHAKVPDKWLIQLFRMGINPEWILTGNGSRYLPAGLSSDQEESRPEEPRPPQDRVIIRNLLYCFPLDDLQAELQRRKASATANDDTDSDD